MQLRSANARFPTEKGRSATKLLSGNKLYAWIRHERSGDRGWHKLKLESISICKRGKVKCLAAGLLLKDIDPLALRWIHTETPHLIFTFLFFFCEDIFTFLLCPVIFVAFSRGLCLLSTGERICVRTKADNFFRY